MKQEQMWIHQFRPELDGVVMAITQETRDLLVKHENTEAFSRWHFLLVGLAANFPGELFQLADLARYEQCPDRNGYIATETTSAERVKDLVLAITIIDGIHLVNMPPEFGDGKYMRVFREDTAVWFILHPYALKQWVDANGVDHWRLKK